MHECDKSSKWLIQHHGDAILRLAGVVDVESWRPLQAEVVQPRQLPDGLIEATCRGRPGPELFVLELATYPDRRVDEQVLRDAALVYLDRRVVPEVLTIVLRPKGHVQVGGAAELRSDRGWTRWQVSWRVVELWTVPAADLLASDDVGVLPWVPLCRIDGPPEAVLRRCRDRIDRAAPADERENMLAVTQVLAGLRYNDPSLLRRIFGGREAMIESPILQELKAEWSAEAKRQSIARFLHARFGADPDETTAALAGIVDEATVDELTEFAALCPDLESFLARLHP